MASGQLESLFSVSTHRLVVLNRNYIKERRVAEQLEAIKSFNGLGCYTCIEALGAQPTDHMPYVEGMCPVCRTAAKLFSANSWDWSSVIAGYSDDEL